MRLRRKLKKQQRRVRRDPAAARELILEAAKQVLARLGPDRAGLKDVAREAGVSHGLVTHYFGTYGALVEAALEDNAMRAQAAIIQRLSQEPVKLEAIIDLFFDLLEQPLQGRLMAWAMMSGRVHDASFFARRVKGPLHVADAIEARARVEFPGAKIDRQEIDRLVLLVMTAGFGITLSQSTLWEALGYSDAVEARQGFRHWLAEVVRMRLDATMRVGEDAPP